MGTNQKSEELIGFVNDSLHWIDSRETIFNHQNGRRDKMNKVTKSIKKLSPIFDLLMGVNFATALEKVMGEYPDTRYTY